MRYLVRPRKMRITPHLLRDTLGYRRSYAYPNRQDTPQFDWNTDLLIAVPLADEVCNTPDEYPQLRRLYAANKWRQRLWLHEHGFPTPLRFNEGCTTYVRRPLRHHSGRGFQVLESESNFGLEEMIAHNNVADNYISPLFKRTHEYRIVMHKGKVVCTILKRNDAELSQTQAWNGANGSYFVTVRNPDNNRLRHTNAEHVLINNPILRCAHLLGVDILLNHDTHEWCISEINFAPSLTIQSNIEELHNAITTTVS